jgi:hypothetical protein
VEILLNFADVLVSASPKNTRLQLRKFQENNCYQFCESYKIQCFRKVAVHSGYGAAVYRDRPRTLNELKTAINVITAYIRNISQADLQKMFENKIKRAQAFIDARGHHLQRFLLVHSDFSKALYINTLHGKISDLVNGNVGGTLR